MLRKWLRYVIDNAWLTFCTHLICLYVTVWRCRRLDKSIQTDNNGGRIAPSLCQTDNWSYHVLVFERRPIRPRLHLSVASRVGQKRPVCKSLPHWSPQSWANCLNIWIRFDIETMPKNRCLRRRYQQLCEIVKFPSRIICFYLKKTKTNLREGTNRLRYSIPLTVINTHIINLLWRPIHRSDAPYNIKLQVKQLGLA